MDEKDLEQQEVEERKLTWKEELALEQKDEEETIDQKIERRLEEYAIKNKESTEEEKSPLTIRMDKFSRQISVLIVVVAIIVAMVLKSKGFAGTDIFLSVIALSVSAMPEGLHLALTMALTIASNKMLKKKVK